MNPVKFVYNFFDEAHTQAPRAVFEVDTALNFATGDKVWLDEFGPNGPRTVYQIEHQFERKGPGLVCVICIRCRL